MWHVSTVKPDFGAVRPNLAGDAVFLKNLILSEKQGIFNVMNRLIIYVIFLLFVISVFLLSTCEKQEYDLFPLKAGNEFYYTYYKYRYTGISAYTSGNERWKVISVSSQGNSNVYTIERSLNAILKVAGQTIIISDSLKFFEIREDKSSSLISFSSMLLYKEISFKRYRHDPVFEIKQEGNSTTEGWRYLFKADSGLTKYTYYHPPNQITNESLHLDSLKIFR